MAALAEPGTTSLCPRVAAEPDDELFDLLDEAGQPLGVTERRGVVHARGLYHRAVYCFVLDAAGSLLLQRRAAGKKVGPRQWDLSLAEHLQPGEGYRDAVLRGLEEELGIPSIASSAGSTGAAVQGPLGAVHLRRLALPAIAIFDNEFVESYVLRGFRGALDVNPEEVSEVRWVPLAQVQQEMAAAPEQFTLWFREELLLVLPLLLQS